MHRIGILGVLICWMGLLGLTHEAEAQSKSVQHTLAKKHFELGQEYYQTADYTKALEEFEQAYRLESLPELAFNMGRCYEALNNLERALQYFRLYLEKKPSTPDKAVLELRIKNIEKRLAQQNLARQKQQEQTETARRKAVSEASQKALARSKAQETTAVSAEESAVAPEDRGPLDQSMAASKPWRVPVGWTLVGVGAASLVTGIVFGAMVSSKNSEYNEARDAGKTHDELQAIQDSADQFQTLQIVTLVAGGVLAAAGGGLLIWHWTDDQKREPAATVGLYPFITYQTAGLGMNARF